MKRMAKKDGVPLKKRSVANNEVSVLFVRGIFLS